MLCLNSVLLCVLIHGPPGGGRGRRRRRRGVRGRARSRAGPAAGGLLGVHGRARAPGPRRAAARRRAGRAGRGRRAADQAGAGRPSLCKSDCGSTAPDGCCGHRRATYRPAEPGGRIPHLGSCASARIKDRISCRAAADRARGGGSCRASAIAGPDPHARRPARRYFPLRRADTVVWAEEGAPSPLAALLRGVAAAFRALPLPAALLAQGLRQAQAVQARRSACRSQESKERALSAAPFDAPRRVKL